MSIIYHPDCCPVTAREMAWLVLEAYKLFYDSRQGISEPVRLELEAGHYHLVSVLRGKALKKLGRQKIIGYVATRDNCAYLVFRGTESLTEWLGDGKFLQAEFLPGWGRIHRGFRRFYQGCSPILLPALAGLPPNIDKLVIAGHSLGAALATLACVEIFESGRFKQLSLYTFASPRVGNPAFARKFGETIPQSYRIFNTEDLIPTEPKAATVGSINQYAHVGLPIAFTHLGGSILNNHMMESHLKHL